MPKRLSLPKITFVSSACPLLTAETSRREEEQSNGPPAVVLSDAFWKRAFGGDPRIIGKSISLSGTRYEVIGVMGAKTQTETPEPIDVWLPFPIDPNSNFQAHYFQALGRLKRGISLDTANARLQLTTQEFRRKFPNTLSTNRGRCVYGRALQDVLVKDARSSLINSHWRC